MRTRSTGLGSTELVQQFRYMKPRGDYLVIGLETTEPVKWQVRAAATYLDVFAMMRILFKPPVIWWIVTGFVTGVFTGFRRAKNPRPMDDF